MTTQTNQRSARDLLLIGAITLLILMAMPLLAAVGMALQLGFVVIAPLAAVTLALALLFLRSKNQLTPNPVKGGSHEHR